MYYNNRQDILYFGASIAYINYASVTGIAGENLSIKQFKLQQNYPNPFNPSTTINYSIAKEGQVKLNVYDMLGNNVAAIANENKQPGNYSIQFNASALPSGIYFYRLESAGYSDTKKFILMK
jgi:hypothetical protein